MAWTVVPALDELRDQLNKVAPDRDKTSDGSIGDTSHAAGRSSHNPDRTGNPEYADGDSADEVRARDFDKDLRHPDLTMLEVVRHLVTGARAGRFWWLRYVIYQGVIYHRDHGWRARAYTGVNTHDHHAHVNSDFNQRADTVRGVDYHLEDLVALTDDDKKWIQGQLAPLKSTDVAVNPIAKLQIPDFAQPEANRRKLSLATWIGYTDSNRNADKAALLKAIAALPQVDTDELIAALAPILVEAVIAGLPEDRDDITPAELQDAIVGALKVLVERPPATS